MPVEALNNPKLDRDGVAHDQLGIGDVSRNEIKIGLFTGCRDKPYAFGFVTALLSKGLCLEVIGSDEIDSPDLRANPQLSFLNLGGWQRHNAGSLKNVLTVLSYYAWLFPYSAVSKPKIFHILWNYKLEYFDRTLLMVYYKLLGKKIVLTAHNVNAGKRDSTDSWLNRLTLRIQYRFADHIFVHTEKMKTELLDEFRVRETAVTVIPFGINNSVPNTSITSQEAKQRLGINKGEKAILFFGNIGPYKGLEILVRAFQLISAKDGAYRLIIAGKPRGGCEKYLAEISQAINDDHSRTRIIQRIEYVPDEETELYFKAADLLVLPYTHVFQSGVFFLGCSFGLPIVATDVGSLREDIIEGKTGFLCRPRDPFHLAQTMESYFQSDLYEHLEHSRQEIREYAYARHSWNAVGEMTRSVYERLLGKEGTDRIWNR